MTMAGLNDEVLNEFKAPEDAGDGITEPNGVPGKTDQDVVVLDTDTNLPVTEDVDFLPFLEEQEVWIKNTEDNEEQLFKLQDVANTIMATESISRTEVADAFASISNDALLSQFTEEVSSLAGFTTLATSTNLEETQQFFGRRAEEAKAAVATQYQQIRNNDHQTVRDSAATFLNYVRELIPVLDGIQKEAVAAHQIAMNSKNGNVLIAEKHGSEQKPSFEKKLVDIRYMDYGYISRKVSCLLGLDETYLDDYQRLQRTVTPGLREITCFDVIRESAPNCMLFREGSVDQDVSGSFRMDYMRMLAKLSTGRLKNALEVLCVEVERVIELLPTMSDRECFLFIRSMFRIGCTVREINALNQKSSLIIAAFNKVL
jgi:hypothetical protein